MSEGALITEESIINKIYLVRGQKVMFDNDLAEMYGVETKVLNQAVKRNAKRFPPDFMFQLKKSEWANLKSQTVTSSWGGRRTPPFAFNEQGVAMLSSVLNSDTAIEVNIRIIRIFTRMREALLTHKDILLKVEQIEKKINQHDEEIQAIFDALKELLVTDAKPRIRIGFKTGGESK